MDEDLSIKVLVDGKEYTFEGRLATVGYTHRFYVVINGVEVTYEPDEERSYRAIINGAHHAAVKDLDLALIKAVGDKIQSA